MKKNSRERINEVEKLEATLERKENDTRRLKEDLERKIREEENIQSKYHKGAKQKTYNRKTRSQTVGESYRERSRRSKSNSRDYRNDRYVRGRYKNEGRRYGDYADRDEEGYSDQMTITTITTENCRILRFRDNTTHFPDGKDEF